MPQMPSIPYASPSMYNSDRGTERLIDLMLRRGDVEARGQAASGEIWGRAVQDVGQIAGQAVAQYSEDKKQKQREETFNKALEGFDPQNPMATYRQLTTFMPPRDAAQTVAGIVSFQTMAQKAQQNEDPTPEEYKTAVIALGASEKAVSGFIEKHYGTLSPIVKRGAALYSGVDLPDQPAPEQLQMFTQAVLAQHAEWATKKPQTPDQIRAEAQARAEGTAAGTPVKPEKTLADLEAESAARARGAATVRPSRDEKMYEVELPGPNGTLTKTLKTEAEMRSGVTVAPRSTGNKPVTGAERQSLAYYNRAREAVDGIEGLEDRVAKRSYASQEWNTRAPNVLKSEDQQVYDQRQRAFTEARLRKESGAAIPESEFANDRRTYWAVPGDSEATIKQKRASRAKVLNGLGYSAGKAYEEYYGEPGPKGGSTPAVPEPPKVDPLGIRRP